MLSGQRGINNVIISQLLFLILRANNTKPRFENTGNFEQRVTKAGCLLDSKSTPRLLLLLLKYYICKLVVF